MNIKAKTHNLYKIIFLFVVFLGIGYAFLEANLNINGDVTVEAPEFNTYVQSVSVTTGSTSGTPAIVGNDKKEVDFSTVLTNDVNSFFEETTTLTNKGSQKSYLRSIDVKVYDGGNEITLSNPYEYVLTHGDGTSVESGEEIAAGSTISYKLKFKYKSGTTQVTDFPTYTFKITYNFTKDLIILPTGKTKDNLTTGDEIWVRGEYFNFIKYDGTNNEDIVMLAKYNLNVGDNPKGVETFKQDSEVRGTHSQLTTYGNVAFSATNYWQDGSGLKPEYGSSYPANVYDNQYKTAPDFNNLGYGTTGYSVAYYVEEYKDILESYGITIKEARLLTYAEATDPSIGCSGSTCPSSFITNTTFYIGTAQGNLFIHNINNVGNEVTMSIYSGNYGSGVRPVIVISKSNI